MIPAATRTLRIAPGSPGLVGLAGTLVLLASTAPHALEPPLTSPTPPTPAFRVRQRPDGAWQFLRPSGDPFFSLGVCCVNQGIERDRYQSFYYPEVARAAAPYVDVISCNLNAAWNDGQFPRFQLETLHALTSKPVLVSEFYLAAMENRSGNRNNHGVFPVTTTQRLRAHGVRQTLRHLRALPYVVGADWFQFSDDPTHGRDDGENHNFGLVDIHDQPYAELTRTFADLSRALANPPSPHPRRDARDGVPPAPRRPLEHFEPRRALEPLGSRTRLRAARLRVPARGPLPLLGPGHPLPGRVRPGHSRRSLLPRSNRPQAGPHAMDRSRRCRRTRGSGPARRRPRTDL